MGEPMALFKSFFKLIAKNVRDLVVGSALSSLYISIFGPLSWTAVGAFLMTTAYAFWTSQGITSGLVFTLLAIFFLGTMFLNLVNIGFHKIWNQLQPYVVSTPKATQARNTGIVESSNLAKAGDEPQITIEPRLAPLNNSQIDCIFASTITDPLQQCSYSIVDLKQWSMLDNKYFNREEKLPNISSQAIGLIEGRAKPKKPILYRQNQRFYFHGFGGLLNSTVYRARRDTIWTLTINASSGLQVITQKEIHFKCVGEKDFKLGDTIKELVNPTQPS
jgi:hypothetical protein